jgi:uncharacterized protein
MADAHRREHCLGTRLRGGPRPPGETLRAGEVVRHVTWFLGAVQNFRFFDLKVFPFADSEGAVGQVMAEGTIKSTGRIYQQEYVVFLRAKGGKDYFHARIF